jgi:type II secretory pathway pseudopilin PulG
MRVRPGHSLIETLVVLAIIGLMMSMLFPAIQRVRESANRLVCENNLRQIGIALHNYHQSHRELPPGYFSRVAKDGSDLGPGWGWAAFLLDYLEQDNLRRHVAFDLDIADPKNATVRMHSLAVFRCPTDDPDRRFTTSGRAVTVATSNYVAAYGPKGPFYRNSRVRLSSLENGTSHTRLVGERSSNTALSTWTGAVTGATLEPRSFRLRAEGAPFLVMGFADPNSAANFSSRHAHRPGVLMGDGAVILD